MSVRKLMLVVVPLVLLVLLLIIQPWDSSTATTPDVPADPREPAPTQRPVAIRLPAPQAQPAAAPLGPPVESVSFGQRPESRPTGATRSGNRLLFDNGWWAPTAEASRQDFAEYGTQMWNKVRQDVLTELVTLVPETQPEKYRGLRRQLAWAEVGLSLAREDRWLYFGEAGQAPQNQGTEEVNYLRLVHEGKMLMGEVKRSEFPDAFNFDIPRRR